MGEDGYSVACLLMVFVAIAIPRLARSDFAFYKANLEGLHYIPCSCHCVNTGFSFRACEQHSLLRKSYQCIGWSFVHHPWTRRCWGASEGIPCCMFPITCYLSSDKTELYSWCFCSLLRQVFFVLDKRPRKTASKTEKASIFFWMRCAFQYFMGVIN
jgi:hypothetical protein